ncbi:MAG: NFACT RNA binding domain-containing protein, partial [Campylobacterales bacterium]
LLGQDKILKLDFEKTGSYKATRSSLILELTGRYTNAVLLDENGVILEVLKRVTNTVRTLAPGEPYAPPPPLAKAPVMQACEDIRALLLSELTRRENGELESQKAVHLAALEKKIARTEETLKTLPTPQNLQSEADRAGLEGGLILSNLHAIAPWSKRVTLSDYEGRPVTLDLEGSTSPQQEANRRFALSRKLKARAKGVFQEIDNLQSRIAFYRRLQEAIRTAQSPEALEATLPQKSVYRGKESTSGDPVESFVIAGFKVLLGRNERGNIAVLKKAKASDIWVHLKDRPSAHVLIQTHKQKLPPKVIDQAALLCARFSVAQKGVYLVDYTERRYVKIKDGANVNYTHYKTVGVTLE